MMSGNQPGDNGGLGPRTFETMFHLGYLSKWIKHSQDWPAALLNGFKDNGPFLDLEFVWDASCMKLQEATLSVTVTMHSTTQCLRYLLQVAPAATHIYYHVFQSQPHIFLQDFGTTIGICHNSNFKVPRQAHGRKPLRQADQKLSHGCTGVSRQRPCFAWSLSQSLMQQDTSSVTKHQHVDVVWNWPMDQWKWSKSPRVNTMSIQMHMWKACHWNQETWAASGKTSPSLIIRTDLGNKAHDQIENIHVKQEIIYGTLWINHTLPYYSLQHYVFKLLGADRVEASQLENLLWWVWQNFWELDSTGLSCKTY